MKPVGTGLLFFEIPVTLIPFFNQSFFFFSFVHSRISRKLSKTKKAIANASVFVNLQYQVRKHVPVKILQDNLITNLDRI